MVRTFSYTKSLSYDKNAYSIKGLRLKEKNTIEIAKKIQSSSYVNKVVSDKTVN
jgi:hypothetical protein